MYMHYFMGSSQDASHVGTFTISVVQIMKTRTQRGTCSKLHSQGGRLPGCILRGLGPANQKLNTAEWLLRYEGSLTSTSSIYKQNSIEEKICSLNNLMILIRNICLGQKTWKNWEGEKAQAYNP